MNEVLKTIAARYSCRAFTGQTPTDDQMKAIADAALASPSAMNRQPWRIIVVKNKQLIEEMDAEGLRIMAAAEDQSGYQRIMSRGGRLFYNAPCAIVIPVDNSGLAKLDCGIVSQNVALAASSLGLGSVICGMLNIPLTGDKGAEFKRRLGFPDGFDFGMSVLIGYAEKPGSPHPSDESKLIYAE